MPDMTFWATQGNAVPVPVTGTGNTGDTQTPRPTATLPGTLLGAIPSSYKTSAQTVYPMFGVGGVTLDPPYTALDINTFTQWHSAYQAAYIAAEGPFMLPPNPLGPGVERQAYYLAVQNGTRPINIINMTLSDYAMLSDADKLVVGPAMRAEGVADRLGLTNQKTALLSALNSIITKMNNGGLKTAGENQIFADQVRLILKAAQSADMVIAAKVLQQAQEVEKRYDRAKLYADTRTPQTFSVYMASPDSGNYWSVLNGVQAQTNAVSSDNNATINKGYDEFIRAERVMLTMQRRREGLSMETGFRDPRLDVANLIYQLQLLYEAEAEGLADAGTEEMNQLHKLLQDYGIMQRLINETLKAYNQKDPEQKRRFMDMGGRTDENRSVEGEQRAHIRGGDNTRIVYQTAQGNFAPGGMTANDNTHYDDAPGYPWFALQASGLSGSITNGDDAVNMSIVSRYSRQAAGNPGRTNGGLSAEEMRVFSMFSDDAFARQGSTRQPHPMEALYGIGSRPKQRFTTENNEGDGSLALLRFGEFNGFLTQLNDTVTLLNQKNQIKQNEIETASRRQNRHFELGNNALRKMNDMLMTIGRM